MLIREHPIKVIEGTTEVGWNSSQPSQVTVHPLLPANPHDVLSSQPILRTGQETSQPNRAALEYWANGLEPIYLEGAFARAEGRLL